MPEGAGPTTIQPSNPEGKSAELTAFNQAHERLTHMFDILKDTCLRAVGLVLEQSKIFNNCVINLNLQRFLPQETGGMPLKGNIVTVGLGLVAGTLCLWALVASWNTIPSGGLAPASSPTAGAQGAVTATTIPIPGYEVTPTPTSTPAPEIEYGNFSYTVVDTANGIEVWVEGGWWVLCYLKFSEQLTFSGNTQFTIGDNTFLPVTWDSISKGSPIWGSCPTDPNTTVYVLVRAGGMTYSTLQ